MSSVFIGMPVYNGALFISEAIDSIRHQSFTDWTLIISDNASEDTTQEICEKYVKIDPRIHYIRQIKNIGAQDNFGFLLNHADAEFFMWAAADDLWDKNFIKDCVFLLQKDKTIAFAFCNIVNIDSYGRVIREYPSFKKFSGSPSIKTIFHYLISPECLGKANLVYSIFRLKICKDAWEACPLPPDWGSDMCFVLGALARGSISIDDKVLFYKRLTRETDALDEIDKIDLEYPKKNIFPFEEFVQYFKNNLNAVKGTKFYWLTAIVLLMRTPRSLFNWVIG